MADGSDDAPPGMPRWVKISLLVVAALVLIVALAKLTGVGGEHGPSRHGGINGSGEVEVDGGGHRSPIDHGG